MDRSVGQCSLQQFRLITEAAEGQHQVVSLAGSATDCLDIHMPAIPLEGVQTCGVMEAVPLYELDYLNVIRVRLLGFARTIGIEVWDSADQPAVLPASYQDVELQGLALVDARAKDWGSAVTPNGRVTWAALDVYDRAASGLPIRTPRPTAYPRPSEGVEDRRSQDADFLRRLRDGLEGL